MLCVHSPREAVSRPPAALRAAFTLVELLVVIGIIAVLISILLPALSAARKAAMSVQCMSNIRQLLTGCAMYANENQGHWPAGSDDGYWLGPNNHRWHGARASNAEAFDFNLDPSPLKRYLQAGKVKVCPAWGDNVPSGYETGCGGYGYNYGYIGGSMYALGRWDAWGYQTTAKVTQIKKTAEKIAFADSAAPYNGALVESSFLEPPDGGGWPLSPTIHFRHNNRYASIGWADGHVTSEPLTWTWKIGDPGNYYGIDLKTWNLGWFGATDNRLFQRE